MLRRTVALIFAVAALASCGAKTLYVHNAVVGPSAPDKVLACTKAQYDSMGYKVSRYDTDEGRLEGKKNRRDIQRSEPSFYRAFDMIEAQATPDASGHTTLKLVGHTFYDSRTYQGPKDLEQPASDTVKADLARVTQRCGATQLY